MDKLLLPEIIKTYRFSAAPLILSKLKLARQPQMNNRMLFSATYSLLMSIFLVYLHNYLH